MTNSKRIKFTRIPHYNYIYAKPSIDYINYMDHLPQTLPNHILKPIVESRQILEFDDKFGLGNIKDPKIILNHLKATNFSYSFNDLRYFLRRIEQLYHEKQSSLNPKLDNTFKKFVNEIKTRLKNEDHDAYPYIGTYAHCLMRLNVQDKELWELLENKIRDDQFYTNFKEVTYACEGFVMLNMFKNQERIDYIYKRLERIVILTIWENNMIYFKRIAEALVSVNRFDSEVFRKLEKHIMNNLAMEYELHIMVDILLAFAKSNNGTKSFYNAMQYVLTKGHMFNKNPLLENRIELPYSGRLLANIVEIYSNVNGKFHNFELEPNFKVMVYKMLTNKKIEYELVDIVKLIKYVPAFQYEEENLLVENVINRIPQINYNISFEEIRDFLELMLDKNMISLIPIKTKQFLENYIINQIATQSERENLKTYNFLIENNLYLDLNALNSKMIEFVNNNLYKMDVLIVKSFIEKLQEIDGKILKDSCFNKINDVLLLNKIEMENKNSIEHKKN